MVDNILEKIMEAFSGQFVTYTGEDSIIINVRGKEYRIIVKEEEE